MQLKWVGVATSLWVATAMLGAVPAGAGGRADHLLCYRMTDKLAVTAAVDMIADLQPQFTQRGCTIVKPIEFCVPASKLNVQPPPNATEVSGQPLRQDYVCYLAKCEKKSIAPASQLIADQFGMRPESGFKAAKICVPATKSPAECGAATSPTCGGTCPPGEVCHQAPTGAAGCTCAPAPCGGAPDKAGVCGGDCPGDELCRPSANAAGKVLCTCQQQPPPPCGQNPLTGSCAGDCADATLKCLPDPDGSCTCQQPPGPGDLCALVPGALPVCGGDCPNPADTCVASTADPNKPCVCEPAACHQDPLTGACSGTCTAAAGDGTCHLDATSHQCTCGPPPCAVDPANEQCGGPCPDGETCAANAANQCGCITPCGFNQDQVCGGGCPPGTACMVQGQECTCVPPPPCGFGAESAGACSGSCPAGTSCHTQAAPKGLACVCRND
jgi:hypothetical protein